ncbi:MAG: hypothetical protein V4754_12280 [Pseudomonadota bacterium]
MKPDSNPPGSPFDFDAIPLWMKPDLWNEKKIVRYRGCYFIFLYSLSTLIFASFIFVPIGIYQGSNMIYTTIAVWICTSLPWGLIIGVLAWRDFAVKKRKIEIEFLKFP